ncbi:allantoate amidohydrolase [Marinilactibacillus sp. 15R]|uniref:Allantoate deiminase n=1 Tax=Marinilactibacillus piezotolerans TaxID=258723 RepID=A0A1I3ZD85_9LACT|nr:MULTISPECIES: Zn-dependent hydrolase [Marinilactibacillus]API88662.1 allantoate amidohydrolase [Marinilactibacillus sp. 15R]SFK42084.1 allantoate deiminase [Marinilactibacillus piezotolerans]
MGEIYIGLYEKLLESYNDQFSVNGISGERLAERLSILANIGLTEDNGSRRPGFSTLEREAKDRVIEWMQEAGLAVSEDGAGNIFGRLEGKDSKKAAIMSGSHVDTVPNGGHFDGTIGVLSALEVAQAWKDTGYVPEKPYEVVIFTDEEGSRFNGGLTGSEAMVGDTDMEKTLLRKDYDDRLFEEVIQDVGLTAQVYSETGRDLDEIETFVEVHIEQGKKLEKAGLPCGIVTGIAGPYWLKVTFEGLAGHAGNTPMDDRKDALVAASEFIQKISTLPRTINDTAVATVGNIQVKPNGTNVIPGEVILFVDIRDIRFDSRTELVEKIVKTGEKIQEHTGVKFMHQNVHDVAPVPISEKRQERLAQSMTRLGIEPYYLSSGAGHDAMIVGRHIPSAMLFVKSKDGISHNPKEWSDLSDCIQTIQVLKDYIEKLQVV